MAGLRLPLHGRNHRPAGSDPIPNLITEIESSDSSVTVTNPNGPTVDLSVAQEGCGQLNFAFMDSSFVLQGQMFDTRPIRKAIAQAGLCLVLMSRTQQLTTGTVFFVNCANVDSISHNVTGFEGRVTRLATNETEEVQAPLITLAAGASASLAWLHAGGNSIMNFTTPATPKIPAAGLYAIDLNIRWS